MSNQARPQDKNGQYLIVDKQHCDSEHEISGTDRTHCRVRSRMFCLLAAIQDMRFIACKVAVQGKEASSAMVRLRMTGHVPTTYVT